MKIVKTVNNEDETIKLGEMFGKVLIPGCVITLDGELGAGKTTFTKGIGKGLGVTRIINSPTFTILKEYHGHLDLHHFDAYRLEGQDDDLGFEEILNDDGVSVIEWSQYIEDILPKERINVKIIKIDANRRTFEFYSNCEKYDSILEELL